MTAEHGAPGRHRLRVAARLLGVLFLRDLDPSSWPNVRELEKESDEQPAGCGGWRVKEKERGSLCD